MRCPNCQAPRTFLTHTRGYTSDCTLREIQRLCKNCGTVFLTSERITRIVHKPITKADGIAHALPLDHAVKG